MTKRGAPEQPGPDERADPQDADRPTAAFPVHEHIGRQLRAMFDDVEQQPLPDRIRKLLEKLERKRSED
jgi:anti-sigma factor NepR-like protein